MIINGVATNTNKKRQNLVFTKNGKVSFLGRKNGHTFVSSKSKNTVMTTKQKILRGTNFLTETQSRLVHVVFGMPSLNCSRYGICRIEDRSTEPLDDDTIQQQSNTALAEMFTQGTNVVFTFKRNSMTESDTSKFFGNDTFLMEEDKPLSPHIAAQFGLETAIILRGSYPIKRTDDTFEISAKMMIHSNIEAFDQTKMVA